MYAKRDIRKGEEIMTDYEMYNTVWSKVGLKGENDDDDIEDDDAIKDDDRSDV